MYHLSAPKNNTKFLNPFLNFDINYLNLYNIVQLINYFYKVLNQFVENVDMQMKKLLMKMKKLLLYCY